MNRLDHCRMQKCVIMGSSPLDLYARDYFNSLNSIAQKISADITTTVAAYEDLWHTLSIKDQHQVINETIIHPEVVLKYSLCKSEDYRTVQTDVLSRSYCNEEVKGMGVLWNDEHSAPFSWKTRSQQDLSVFSEDSKDAHINSISRSSLPSKPQEKFSSDHDLFIDPPNIVLGGSSSKLAFTSMNVPCGESNNFLDKMKSKSVVLKIQPMKGPPNKIDRNVQSSEIGSSTSRVNGNCKASKTLPSRLISKPKNPPPPPPKSKQLNSGSLESSSKEKTVSNKQILPQSGTEMSTFAENELFMNSFNNFHVDINTTEKNNIVPKTGFDFLDNW